MSRALVSLVFIVLLAAGGLIATVAAGNEPALGLDLQGGVAIVLEPTRDVEGGELDQSIEILRNRVDALGVAEPEITRQGDTIVVQLPGVTDRERAREIVGQTAELRFRPVLQVLPADEDVPVDLDGSGEAGEGDPADESDQPSEPSPTTEANDTSDTTDAGDEAALGEAPEPRFHAAQATQEDPETTTTEELEDATSTTVAGEEPTADGDGQDVVGTTPREADDPDEVVVLPELVDGEVVARYRLGPAELTGEVVSTASARFGQGSPGWSVNVDFTATGSEQWDAMAARYFQQRIAIVLDGVVVSAPQINAQEFGGTAVITGDFSEGEAKDLALVLRYGALPVELEAVNTVEVSATLGRDALDAGVIAGLIGVAAVGLYLILYYRLLGLVVVTSLAVAGALLWTIIAYLGSSQGLALTLAGATGIIVSIGVAVDSNIVYYERIKEEVRTGKTLRSSVDQAFSKSFSTILKADAASLIGAGLLYWLTVGPVRGFALFLGLATLLDVIVSWFYMRPAAMWLARSRVFGRPALLGIPEPTRSTEPVGGAR